MEGGDVMFKVIMDSGKEYEIESDLATFLDGMKNQLGITINGFIVVKGGLIINPSHISSIEHNEK